jgi:hypothetical protein
MADARLSATHPTIASAIDAAPASEVADKVRRLVEAGLRHSELSIEDRRSQSLGHLVDELDAAAWDIQDRDDLEGRPSYSGQYEEAFTKARAANALLEFVSGKLDAAVYEEAVHALQGDERVILTFIGVTDR